MALFTYDIFDRIKDDHRQVMEIFDQLQSSDETCVQRRPQLLQHLCDELLPHMAAEENLIYPLMEDGEKNHRMHLQVEEEHRAARQELEELRRCDPHDERFLARCTVLRNLIRLHVTEEESVVFLMVRSHITNQQTIDLVEQFQAAKERFRREQGEQPQAA